MLRYAPDGAISACSRRTAQQRRIRLARRGRRALRDGQRARLLGDDFPPCELNRIPKAVYGWPFANGNRIADPDFGDGREP